MFFFGKKAVQADARNLAEWVLKFRNDLFASDELAAFIAKLEKYPVEESYVDERKKECGWFLRDDKRFSFHANFAFTHDSPRCLTVESHKEYFGVIITSSSIDRDVDVTLNDSHVVKLGSKAAELRKTLLSFPGFSDVREEWKNILGR